MKVATRTTLWASLALAAFSTGCSSPTAKPDSGVTVDDDCISDTDCADPQYFFCNTVSAKCEPSCRNTSQCNSERPAQYALPHCLTGLGCQCDEGKCVGSLCSADVDCGGTQVCRNGACVSPPAKTAVTKCEVTPSFAVLPQGGKARFWVSAWDAQNNPVVVKEGATWSALDAAVTGSGDGATVEFTAGTSAVVTAVEAVQASFGTVNCKAKVLVLEAPTAGNVAVSAIDELTGRPVPGAKVLVSLENGAPVGTAVETNALGYAMLPLTGAPAKYSVTVFHADFTYVTVANYSGASKFLSFALRRNPLDKFGGYKSSLVNVPATGNVHAAIGGTSLGGSVTSVNLLSLLGPSVPTDLVIGSINQPDRPIPAGAFLGFGEQKIKNDLLGQGQAGVCLKSDGSPDEDKITKGECGTRSAWALAGDVKLGDLPISEFTTGLDGINVGNLLSKIIPLFKGFNSSVIRDVQFTLKGTPGAATGNPDFSDQSHYTTVTHDFTQIPLAFNFAVKVPELPKFRNSYADLAVVLSGAHVPGRGIVPLGLGIGANTDPNDGQIDKLDPLPAGQFAVRMAPTHHGLEGVPYGLLMGALSIKSFTDASAGAGLSALFPRVPGNKLAFDPKGSTPLDLSTQSFPKFAEGAKFNFTGAVDGALAARGFHLATALTGIDVVRVSFSDISESRWDVLVSPESSDFVLPEVPLGSTLRDRLYADSTKTSRSDFVVQGFRMLKDPTVATSGSISFNDYVEFNDTNADRTTDFITAFSFLQYGRPKVSFDTPKEDASTIAKGEKIVVKVKNYSIGKTAGTNDGVVKLTFVGGTGCEAAELSTETEAGSGKLEYTLPTACSGAVTMTAELLKIDGTTPQTPAIKATIAVTIQ